MPPSVRPLFHVGHGPQSPLSSLALILVHFLVFPSTMGKGDHETNDSGLMMWIYRQIMSGSMAHPRNLRTISILSLEKIGRKYFVFKFWDT